jgi:hypothetical protein
MTPLLALIAAMVPNSQQWIYERGASMPLIDALEQASYFVFAFALTGAWILIDGWKRWLLLLLVPLALLQRLAWTFALLVWSVRGFAP